MRFAVDPFPTHQRFLPQKHQPLPLEHHITVKNSIASTLALNSPLKYDTTTTNQFSFWLPAETKLKHCNNLHRTTIFEWHEMKFNNNQYIGISTKTYTYITIIVYYCNTHVVVVVVVREYGSEVKRNHLLQHYYRHTTLTYLYGIDLIFWNDTPKNIIININNVCTLNP